MMIELRGALFLLLSFAFFLLIIGMFLLSIALRPGHWSERPRVAN